MPALVFFDSNILVYMDDSSSPAKQQTAIDLVEKHFANETRDGVAPGVAGVFCGDDTQTGCPRGSRAAEGGSICAWPSGTFRGERRNRSD
jgi:hypothetical protein